MFEPSQIASARKRLGLTQTELSRRCGVSQSLIAKIEANQLDPTYSKLRAISDVLEHLDAAPQLTAEKVMHREVVLMFATETVEQGIEHLAHHGISQIPVFDQGTLVGTVTESSLLDHLRRHRDRPEGAHAPVREVMTEALPQVPPETGLDALLSVLDVFPAVLVSANGRLQGIVTKSDLLRHAQSPSTRAPSQGAADGRGAARP